MDLMKVIVWIISKENNYNYHQVKTHLIRIISIRIYNHHILIKDIMKIVLILWKVNNNYKK
jgi:hypothetical protein